jgi:hypothetical protein
MKYILLIGFTFLIVSCVQNNKKSDIIKESTTQSIDSNIQKMYSRCYYIWSVDSEGKTMKLNPTIKEEDANLDSIIVGLNCKHPFVQLSRKKFVGDTLILDINDSEYLTQQIGTYGATQYLAETIINLTSCKAAKFVRLNFEEGDHAGPGIWSRNDFAYFKIPN